MFARGSPCVYDERDRDDQDPRDGLMGGLDLPRGEDRELVVNRDRVYELNGEDSRTLAAVGTFRVVPEQDLDIDYDTLGHLRAEGLVETVDLRDDEQGLVLTKEGRDLLGSHTLDRGDEATPAFYAGVSRPREIDHDSNLSETYRQEESRRRSVLVLGVDRPHQLQPATRQAPRGIDARQDRATTPKRSMNSDVQGILAFAERVLPRAADLWVQASLNQKQRLQQLFLPEGIAFDGNRFNRTAATAPLFNYLAPDQSAEESLVSPEGIVLARGERSESRRA